MSETTRAEETPATALDAAASSVQRFFQLSGKHFDDRPGWEYPSDAYDCAGALTELAVQLPNVFEWLMAAIRDQHESHLVGIDSGPHDSDPERAVEAVSVALDRARVGSRQMLSGLTEAHTVLARMFYGGPATWPGERP